ncbi:hypothetical protein RRSWK_04960 [Rhodopirellula sp. SWK7]|nr:hypothetical protein RRSWK_04960 [Rhodopirellula sp. SWK7]
MIRRGVGVHGGVWGGNAVFEIDCVSGFGRSRQFSTSQSLSASLSFIERFGNVGMSLTAQKCVFLNACKLAQVS